MTRAALALLLTTAALPVFGGGAWAQAVGGGGQTAAPAAPAAAVQTEAAPIDTGRPASDSPPALPSDTAVTGATPTSGEPEANRQTEGVTVYRPDFFAASRPNTALEMIQRLPGFQLNSGSNARGFAGTAGNLLIDGKRPASKSDSVDSVVSRIPADRVERIEIIRGGAPGIDMQGQSVVANVIVRDGDSAQQTVTLRTDWFLQSGDNLPGLNYQTTRTVGPRTYEFSGGLGTSLDDSVGRGFRIRRDPAGRITRFETAGTEASGRPLSARGSVKTPLLGGEMRINGTLSRNNFKDEDHFTRPGVQTSIVGKDVSTSGELGLNYTRPLTEALSMELVALQKLAQSEFVSNGRQNEDRDTFVSQADTGESILRGVLRLKRSETLSFEGGGEAAYNFRDGQTALTINGVPRDLPNSSVLVEEKRGEVFATATWRPFANLGLEAGSRFEVSTISATGGTIANERSFFYPKPRLLLTWTPTPSDTVRVRLEREVGQLNFGDFVASANLTDQRETAGNIELEPNKTTVAEVSYERQFWDKGAVSLTLTHGEITDAIDRVLIRGRPDPDPDPSVPDILFDAPGNIGEGSYDQLKLVVTLPLDRFRIPGGELKITDSVVNSEVIDPTTGESRRISGQRPENLRVEYRQDVPRYRLTYGATYLNGFQENYFRYNEVTRIRLDRYFAVFVEFKPNPETAFLVSLENAGRFQLGRERQVFSGPRNTDPLLFTEDFDTEAQQRLVFRLRRTL
jgi:hypothetical protein